MSDGLVKATGNWHPFGFKEGQIQLKSAKKLHFGDENSNIPLNGAGEEDFQINNFSPNDEGPVKPLHIFEHHGISKNIQFSFIPKKIKTSCKK